MRTIFVGAQSWSSPYIATVLYPPKTKPEERLGIMAATLIASMNPCPCGYYGDPTKECTDSLAHGMRYQNPISGPLLDRIDIHVEVPRVDYEKLSSDRLGEPSAKIRERVQAAREWQGARFAGTNLHCYGDMGPGEVRRFCVIDDAGRSLLRVVMQQMSKTPRCLRGQMGARAYHRILKLEWTIADLAESDKIETATCYPC